MNERIKLLAHSAWVDNDPWADNDHLDACGHVDLEKFAELIVRECIANCDDLNSMKYIADHFGIKIEGLE
ncbi:MAG: hypothetical protein EBR82_65470 [Caulobacteraceae bacterium]|nr:hypothetical protein [Caulobacteraceae bacterium]NDB12356.1 hypothetical protein [Betaproteobacteria bacterium]